MPLKSKRNILAKVSSDQPKSAESAGATGTVKEPSAQNTEEKVVELVGVVVTEVNEGVEAAEPIRKRVATIATEVVAEMAETAVMVEDVEVIDTEGLKKDLKQIFKQLNIQKIIYIDDEFNEIYNWPQVVDELLALERETVNELFSDIPSILEAPDDDFLKTAIEGHIENRSASQDGIDGLAVLLKKANITAQAVVESSVLESLELLFDKQILHTFSPARWKAKAEGLKKLINAGPVLILCDQDLKQQETGGDIIKFLKNSEYANSFYCALISDLIVTTQRELTWMKEQKIAGKLPDVNFFALSKERTKEPMLISDGIKKTLLNDYLDKIKSAAGEVLQDAFTKTIAELDSIDTYDFDHSILRASVNEGVWEIDTLLRIVKNVFDKQIKQSMIDKNFLKSTNPVIKKAIDISKTRFKISKEKTFEPPYDKRYRLRHEELYEEGKLINGLYTPISNGDIFTVKFSEQGNDSVPPAERYFILVDQECDIVIRAGGKRNRKTGFTTLLPVTIKTNQEIEADRDKFNTEHGLTNYYFHNRYKLDYFEFVNQEDYKHGIIDFTNPYFINFDVLDLVSFNSDGKTIYTVRNNDDSLCDPDLLSIAIENRMKKVDIEFKARFAHFNSIYEALGDLNGQEQLFEKIKAVVTINPCVNFPAKIGNQVLIKPGINEMEFGITRSLRYNPTNSKNLLNRYNDYLSRFADDHDFAREIKGR